jgi:hypothetical protein
LAVKSGFFAARAPLSGFFGVRFALLDFDEFWRFKGPSLAARSGRASAFYTAPPLQ